MTHANEIVSYLEMCRREGASLQRGMNFELQGGHSVVLMSLRADAPYNDEVVEDGTVLIYEGHDEPRRKGGPDPKTVDQPRTHAGGLLTQNGLFDQAAQAHKRGERAPEHVRVYEKLRAGVWSYNGLFHLVDSWQEKSGPRVVFKFRLVAVPEDGRGEEALPAITQRRRLIPSAVKLEVWRRDGGRCVQCGASDELHFDHVVPYSRGGSSLTAENIQVLCARHNIAKRDQIQ